VKARRPRRREDGSAAGRTRRVVLCVQNLSVPQDRRVWREALTLRAAGHEVWVIGPSGPGLARRERLEGVHVLRWPPPPALPGVIGQVVETVAALAWTAWLLRHVRRAGPIDVFHVANPPDTFVLLGGPMRRRGTRFVYDQHDLCPELLAAQTGEDSVKVRLVGPLLRWLERRSYRAADLVIAPNNSYRQIALARGGVQPDAVVVVRSGPDTVVPPAAPPRWPLVVAFAGMMNPQDRVDVLLDAAALVLARRPGALRIELVGTGDDVPRLRQRALDLGIDDVVEFRGWLSGDDLAARLQQATAAVSLDEDNPFNRLSTMTKVPEYLALGLPSVVADLPENRISAGGAARYFAPGDPADLARQLEVLLDQPDELRRLRAEACRRAPALRWEHSASRLVAAYRWLLDGGPAVPGEQHVEEARGTAA
jgi:glycosyltransferase involved in cell wall biosynthesis